MEEGLSSSPLAWLEAIHHLYTEDRLQAQIDHKEAKGVSLQDFVHEHIFDLSEWMILSSIS